jgi:muramoyltetrapeptide carboxypeptidase
VCRLWALSSTKGWLHFEMIFSTLKPGDCIGVVAPAGPVTPEQLAAVPALYEAHGLRVRLFAGCAAHLADCEYLAGDDATRLADLHAALADPEVVALHCIRGGYGAMRLLDRFDQALLRQHPKLLIGYSDITALHALWSRAGLPSLHAPMPASDLIKPGRQDDATALFGLLKGGLHAADVMAPVLDINARNDGLHAPGVAQGVLIGGNLSLVAALLGTAWSWSVDPAQGAILFLEDINEELYRIDRLLTQLRLSGLLAAVSGVLLGSFTEATSPAPLLQQMLVAECQRLGKPLLAGWPSGHGTPNLPLPMGLGVRLDADAGSLTMLQTLLQAK